MKLNVVVLDCDGTIAHGGRLDVDVRSAIADIRAAGLSLRASTAVATWTLDDSERPWPVQPSPTPNG